MYKYVFNISRYARDINRHAREIIMIIISYGLQVIIKYNIIKVWLELLVFANK